MNGYSKRMIEAMELLIGLGFDEDFVIDFLDTHQENFPSNRDELIAAFKKELK